MENFFTYGAIGVAVTLLMYFLNNESKKKPPVDEQGNIMLKMPPLYGIIGVFASVLGVGIFLMGVFKKPDQIWGWLGILILIGGLGMLLVLIAYVSKVKLTEEGIVHKNILGKYKFLGWSTINLASFNSVMLELKISDGTQHIKCHYQLKGFDVLVDNLIQKSGLSKSQMGLP